MKNTREENLDIARRYLDGELTRKEAQAMLGDSRNLVYYWTNEYKRSVGLPATPKRYNNQKENKVNKIIPTQDELERLSTLTKEELIDEVIKARIGEERAKKGYEVKGGGVNKEYVSLNNKNIK